MAASCFNVVRGKRIRVTRLDSCGNYPVPTTANSLVVSDGFISVQYTMDYQAGDEHIQKNADGNLCINDKSCDVFKRMAVKISLCGVDPDLLSLVTSNAVELDASGVDVGFRVQEGLACSTFGLELWSGLGGLDCGNTSSKQSVTEGGAGLTSFTLTYNGPVGTFPETTAAIAAAATAAQVQAALQNAIDPIAPSGTDVVVTGATSGPYTVTFVGRLAGTAITALTATPTGGSGTVTIANVQTGGVSTSSYGYFLLPFVRNGTLRDFTVMNGPTLFEIDGWSDSGAGWGSGPYNVVAAGTAGAASALKVPMSATDHALIRLTTVAPPASACGYQVMPAAPTAAA